VLLAGCQYIPAYERGEVIGYDEAVQRKADLEAFCEEKIRDEEVEQAYFLFELVRLRKFAADRVSHGKGVVPEGYRKLHDFLWLNAKVTNPKVIAEHGPPSAEETREHARQVKALRAAAEVQEQKFWKGFRATERRLAAQAESARPFEMPYASIFAPGYVASSANDARLGLTPEEAVLEYFFAPSGTCYVFLVTREGVEVTELGTDRAGLAALAEELHDRAEHGKPQWEAPARALERELIAPFLPRLEGVETLFLVPTGPLSNVPFNCLLDGSDRPLLERFRLAFLPSFSFYKLAISQPPRDRGNPRVLAIGDGDLAMAPKEAKVASRLFPGSQEWYVLHANELKALNEGTWKPPAGMTLATEDRFYHAYQEFDVYHFATHGGLVPQVPLASALSLTGTPGHDGKLTAAEVRTLDMRHARLAFLSACHSGQSGQRASDDELASIAGAFMVAGVPTVIGSLWPVNDISTVSLMLKFYERFLDLGPAEALRQAQLSVRKMKPVGKLDFSHPKLWAAFNTYGVDQ